MSFAYVFLLIILFMVILAFTAILKVAFTLDTLQENARLTLLWLYPFLKATAEINNSVPVLSIYLFKYKIYEKQMDFGKSGGKSADLVKATSPKDIHFDMNYGFRDPYITGITCGAVNLVSEQVNFASVEQNPDFICDKDYICMNASAKVNIGSTLINLFKSKAISKRSLKKK